jgi:hypothetical protein
LFQTIVLGIRHKFWLLFPPLRSMLTLWGLPGFKFLFLTVNLYLFLLSTVFTVWLVFFFFHSQFLFYFFKIKFYFSSLRKMQKKVGR